MDWGKLKQHCNLWKQGKLLNKTQYIPKPNVPVWKVVKDYKATFADMEQLKNGCSNKEEAIDTAIKDLMKGETLKVMG